MVHDESRRRFCNARKTSATPASPWCVAIKMCSIYLDFGGAACERTNAPISKCSEHGQETTGTTAPLALWRPSPISQKNSSWLRICQLQCDARGRLSVASKPPTLFSRECAIVMDKQRGGNCSNINICRSGMADDKG